MDIGSVGSFYGDLYASKSSESTSKLENQLNTDYSKKTDEELMEVCKQFEAYFVEQMMKEMWKTIPQEETSSSNSMLKDYYQEEMIQQVATESTQQGGFGLAQTLYEQMKRNYSL